MIELCAIQILRCYNILSSIGTFDVDHPPLYHLVHAQYVETRVGCMLHTSLTLNEYDMKICLKG